MRIFLALGILFGLSAQVVATAQTPSVDRLAKQLIGSFSNVAQSRSDPYFKATTLHSTRIGADRADGVWIYVEHALVGAERHPHKQLVYQLIARADATIECKLYELSDPVPFTGAWKNEAVEKLITPEKLIPREACSLIFRLREQGSFHGASEGEGCADLVRGAAYVKTEFVATDAELTIWDRGYTAAGAQIWGHPRSGYAFKRVE